MVLMYRSCQDLKCSGAGNQNAIGKGTFLRILQNLMAGVVVPLHLVLRI